MGLLTKLFLGIISLLVIGGAGFYYLNGINKVSLDDFVLTGIKGVTVNSFTFNGQLFVNNPSKTPVPIQTITYDVILDKTGEIISSGTLPSFILVPGDNTIPFDQRVNWVPTASLAATLVTSDRVYTTVKGRIKIALPQVKEYELPFSSKADIKAYVSQFVDTIVPANSVTDSGLLPSGASNDDVPESSDSDQKSLGVLPSLT